VRQPRGAGLRHHRAEAKPAEAVRFELTDGCPSPVFKTGALNRSATLPIAELSRSAGFAFTHIAARYEFRRNASVMR
jgi:hypothetical protein